MFIIPMALFCIYTTGAQPGSTTEYDNSISIYFKSRAVFYMWLQGNSNTDYSWQFSLSKGLILLMDILLSRIF